MKMGVIDMHLIYQALNEIPYLNLTKGIICDTNYFSMIQNRSLNRSRKSTAAS